MANRNLCMICSGYGRGIINLIKNKSRLHLNICLIICPDTSKELIDIAKYNNISVKTFRSQINLSERNIFVYKLLITYKIDYVFLVGCMFRIKDIILNNFNKRIINIHPSLLPSFKGINAIDQAISYGVKISGITIHFVNHDFDSGEIISQSPICIDGLNFDQIDRLFIKESLEISIKTLNSLSK